MRIAQGQLIRRHKTAPEQSERLSQIESKHPLPQSGRTGGNFLSER